MGVRRKQRQRLDSWEYYVSLHQRQLEVFNDPHRFKVLVCGRRFGKSYLQLSRSLFRCLAFPQLMPGFDINSEVLKPVALIGLPTLKQAKKIIWQPLLNILERCPYVKEIRKADNVIHFVGNRPSLHVVGLNDSDGDRARGLRIWDAAIDETQDIKADIIDAVLLPAMADTPNSSALFTGTPKGKTNHFYALSQRGETDPYEWIFWNFPTWENPFISQTEVERARKILSPRLFQQEFEASFVNFEGQIFAEFNPLDDVIDEAKLPHSLDLFWIGLDPGDVNPALSLVAYSKQIKTFYIIDVWQGGDGSNPVPEEEHLKIIRQWCRDYPRVKSIFVDPSRPGVILDIRNQGQAYNVPAMSRAVAAYNRIEEGISLMNNLFYQDKLKVSSRCGDRFIDDLQSYHRVKNKDGLILEAVAPGQNDHTIDATRYITSSIHNRGGRGQT